MPATHVANSTSRWMLTSGGSACRVSVTYTGALFDGGGDRIIQACPPLLRHATFPHS